MGDGEWCWCYNLKVKEIWDFRVCSMVLHEKKFATASSSLSLPLSLRLSSSLVMPDMRL